MTWCQYPGSYYLLFDENVLISVLNNIRRLPDRCRALLVLNIVLKETSSWSDTTLAALLTIEAYLAAFNKEKPEPVVESTRQS